VAEKDLTMWIVPTIPAPSAAARAAAAARQDRLTKPAGALGRLEALSLQIAAIQDREQPRCESARVLVCAGDHGIAERGVSAFPKAVTAQMCLNFLAGGAAVNVLARQAGATVEVLDVGVAADLPSHPQLVCAKVARGTRDFTREPAMTLGECELALNAGSERARSAAEAGHDVLVLGEMGIANTTSAAALMAAYLGMSAAACIGRGTGVDDAGLARKRAVVEEGLARHAQRDDPLAVLAALGGLEIAAMAGAMIGGAAARRVVVVDGFISSAAALAALRLAPDIAPYLVFSHCGSETGHRRLLNKLGIDPLLALDLRLGEGTGGVLALHLLRAACRTLAEMATFDSAGVSGQS
jgi:nicotinate-nucleotide--dimethylbenzimidazole phosphoribosyltransferase